MKHKLSLLFMFLFCLIIVGCGGDTEKTPEEPTFKMPTIEVKQNMNLYAIEDFKISNLQELASPNLNDYFIETDTEYLTYLSDGYLVANKIGTTTVKVTDKSNSKITSSVTINISDNSSNNEIPNFRISKNYINIDSVVSLRLSNYTDLSLFDIILSDNSLIEIDERNIINPKNTGKVDIYLRLKDDHSCTNKFSLEIISSLPNIYISKDTLLLNEKAYINISNLDKTYEKSLDEYIWTIDSNNANIENNVFYTNVPGTYTITATSIYNPLVKSSHKITVVENNTNLSISLNENYKGVAGTGDQFQIELNGNYKYEDITFSSTNNEVIRIYPNGLVYILNEGYAIITAYETTNPSNKTLYRVYVDGVANVDYVERLLTLALGEVGTVERQDENGNYVNDTKYNHWYNYDGAWCAMFVSWCWYHAGLSNDLLVKYMSCTAGMNWSIANGIFHYKEDYTPKSGDIVFFLSNGAGHTGIVVYCDGDYIYTVEGNRSNRVDVWRLSCINSTITGYASPNYPTYEGTPADFSWIAGKDENGDYYWTPAGNQSTQ